jgi:hypothetical protein
MKIMFCLRFFPSGYSGFEITKKSKIPTFSGYPDLRVPAARFCVPTHPYNSASVVARQRLVSMIFAGGDNSQVFYAIVPSVMVDVINLTLRPFAVVNSPTNTVRLMRLVVE